MLRKKSKVKLNTRPGQLWMFILSLALASALVPAKNKLFRPRVGDAGTSERVKSAATTEQGSSTADERVEEPDFPSRFHSDSDIFLAVQDSMQKIGGAVREASASSDIAVSSFYASQRASKRRRTDSADEEPERQFRQTFVSQIRSRWSERLNFGRSGVGKYFYMRILCISDRSATYKAFQQHIRAD